MELPPEASHHALQVLRLKPEDLISVFNETDGEYLARIIEIHKKRTLVEIQDKQTQEKESSLRIHLAQGISRAERMDYAIQKAVELGVSQISPIMMERCVVKLNQDKIKKRQQHWNNVIISACEQSGRIQPPQLEAVSSLSTFLHSDNRSGIILDPNSEHRLEEINIENEVTVLIGPEGGLSDNEVLSATKAGFTPVRLGPRILRTETAAAAIIAILQWRWGDLA